TAFHQPRWHSPCTARLRGATSRATRRSTAMRQQEPRGPAEGMREAGTDDTNVQVGREGIQNGVREAGTNDTNPGDADPGAPSRPGVIGGHDIGAEDQSGASPLSKGAADHSTSTRKA